MTMLYELAIKWRERRAALSYSNGRRAQAAVHEFFVGAETALRLAGHAEADHVGQQLKLILSRVPFPLATVEQWADAGAAKPKAGADWPA